MLPKLFLVLQIKYQSSLMDFAENEILSYSCEYSFQAMTDLSCIPKSPFFIS